MLGAYKVALGPLLLLQARWLRRTALRLPEADGPRSGHFASVGGEPLRLLFVGDSSAAGVGVSRQEDAVALQSAKFTSERLGRAVSWELIARSGVNTRQCRELVAAANPGPADVIIVALGVNDVTSQCAPAKFIANYQVLIESLRARTGARVAIITGMPPLRILPGAPQPLRWYLGRYGQLLDGLLQDWVRRHDWARYLSLDWAAKPEEMAVDRYHPGIGQYLHWAQLVAGHVEELVAEV